MLVVKNPPANAGRHKRHRFDPWVGKIRWRRAWQPTLVFLPEGSMDRGAWQASVRGVSQSRKQLSHTAHMCAEHRTGQLRGQREGPEGLWEIGSPGGARCDFYVTSMLGVLRGDGLLSGRGSRGADRRLKQGSR